MKTLIKLLVLAAALSLPTINAVAGYHSTTASASNGSNDQSGFNIGIPNGGAAGYVLVISGYGYVSASVSGSGLSIGGSRDTDGSEGNGGAVGAGSVSSSLYASASSGSYASAMAWVSW
jgi:hypothetical protein